MHINLCGHFLILAALGTTFRRLDRSLPWWPPGLLLLAAIVAAVRQRRWPRPALALALILGGLALLSLSSRVYAGPLKLVDLGDKPWEDIFGSFRAPGRAFWPVGYALMLGAVAAVDRMPRLLGGVLLAAAALLQAVDIQPLLHRTRAGWEYGSGLAAPPVPGGTLLFTAAPHPGCSPDIAVKWTAPLMLLDAVRHGAMTGDIGLGRAPAWFNCEGIVSDALELPLLPGESRAFLGRQIQAPLRPELLGTGSICRRVPPAAPPGSQPELPATPATAASAAAPTEAAATQPPIVLCGAGVDDFPGELVPPHPLPSRVTLPFEAGPDDLRGLLGFGWRLGMAGGAWSEGPRSSLLIPVPPGQRLELRLRASGISFRPGEPRQVFVMAGRQPVGQFSLPDGLVTEVTVAIPASTIESGMLRVALNVIRPVDPARRGMAAPVKRAAILLNGVSLRLEPAMETGVK
jgi:hypothetical protein